MHFFIPDNLQTGHLADGGSLRISDHGVQRANVFWWCHKVDLFSDLVASQSRYCGGNSVLIRLPDGLIWTKIIPLAKDGPRFCPDPPKGGKEWQLKALVLK